MGEHDTHTETEGPRAAAGAIARDAGAQELVAGIRAGDRRALARAITRVEDGDESGREVVAALFADTGGASLVGITGPPGVGKSSLVSALLAASRAEDADARVGVVSVDPSSPFTSGALLGDRIRLADHFLDRNVFIRSMGTRGHLGGVAETSLQVALLLDAFGCGEIYLETVGVGQSEVEIAHVADTVVLVLMPGSGDAVQALKAGVMEIPDVIVINKADHPAARTMHNEVRSILLLGGAREWMPPIVETQATAGVGIDKLRAAMAEHRAHLAQGDLLVRRRRENLEREVYSLASHRALAHLQRRVADDPRLRELLDAMHRRELDPVSCTQQLFEEVFRP
jgi:LAO/AO transport system kinase